MSIKIQSMPSQVQVRVNFMKSEDRIAELGSKANYREYGPDNISVVCTIVDGVNLRVNAEEGMQDVTAQLIGSTANIRLTQEMFDALNHEFHEMSAVGAEITLELNDHVRVGFLNTMRNAEPVISVTIYPDSIVEVEAVKVQKIDSCLKISDILAGLEKQKAESEQQRIAAVSSNRVARESAKEANQVVTRF